jgi:hypothetical protein
MSILVTAVRREVARRVTNDNKNTSRVTPATYTDAA